MKCPKCGYNSFDHLESCKKCGGDLGDHKARFGLRTLFFGGGNPEPATAVEAAEEAETKAPEETIAPAATADSGFDFMGEEEPDEDPLESSLDELLGADGPKERDPDFVEQAPSESAAIHRPAEESDDDRLSAAPGFDFAWEEEAQTGTGEMHGDEDAAEHEAFPGFARDEASGLGKARGSESLDELPESFDRDSEPVSEQSQEELPEFVFDEEDPATIHGDFERETVGGDSASVEKAPRWEVFDDPAGDAAETVSESPAAADLFSWDDASEEPAEDQGKPGSPEPNLAELFLESLDDTAGSTGAAPPLFADMDPFGHISSEVPLVKIDPEAHAEDGEETGAGGPSERLWEEEREEAPAAPDEHESPPLSARIGAGATDLLILAMVFVLFLAAGEVALGPDQGSGLFPSLPSLLQLAIPYFLVLFAVCFGYFTLFHFLIGQTPGKMLFRIRVVGEEGSALMFSQAFLRSVGGLLSLIPAGLGYLRIVFDRERRGWNDRLANSRVIHQAGWENPEDLREVGLAEEGSRPG